MKCHRQIHYTTTTSYLLLLSTLILTHKFSTGFVLSKAALHHKSLKNDGIKNDDSSDLDLSSSGVEDNEIRRDFNTIYDELREFFKSELGGATRSRTSYLKSQPCMEIIDQNATISKSLGRSNERLVEIHPDEKFKVAYCDKEGSRDNQCAVDSTCVTIYQWEKALVRLGTVEGESRLDAILPHYFKDEVLIPTGCTCLVNSLNNGWLDKPLIIEH